MIATLDRRSFPVADLRLMASERSAGNTLDTPWGEVVVEDLATADPSGVEVALFSAGGDRSRKHAPRFSDAGAVVVDNSSAWRMEPEVPLVVAGVNDAAAAGHSGIIANPNCTTMVLMMAVGPIHQVTPLRSMVVASYQSVSGSGNQGIEELVRQNATLGADVRGLQLGGWVDPGADLYVRPIGWNVLPFAGNAADQGYTDEEWKLVHETRKILDAPDAKVEPTCVRVPVVVGHGIAATCWFERNIDVTEAAGLVAETPGVEVWHDKVPTPLDSAGVDEVLVGRIRGTVGDPGGISMWVVGDNLRKGAALNTVQIAELVVS
jgi:aspartate-semialdehyde dehydrogenase